MTTEPDYLTLNKPYWDERVDTHAKSSFYDVAGFKAGKSTLDEYEIEAVGDVEGKSLLHLQCHFGMDTLSWARLGANVTGMDFSGEAIKLARDLSREINVPATFVESDLYDLPDVLEGQYDIVFTSHGTVVWLPDIKGWARVVAHFLKPGGRFAFVDGHPTMYMFDYEAEDALHVRFDYFQGSTPLFDEYEASYADSESRHVHTRSVEWNHSLGDIVNALIDAGLRVEWVREYPVCAWQYHPLMVEGNDGFWRLPEGQPRIPMLLSIRATKDR